MNVRLTIDGCDCQLTLRDTDEHRLLVRLHAVLAQYPPPPPPAGLRPAGEGKDWCNLHEVQMRWNEGKDGRKGWHSHKTADGQWCKGKG